MNVLSLFDGISCARVALDRCGIPVANYYASEIDENAITVSKRHYPTIKRLGCVKTVKSADLPRIDYMIFGSPCQDLSRAKNERKGLAGDRSGLFWTAAKILKEVKPRYFIMENVASMKDSDRDAISKELGVQPVMFDASLVSAQSRKRYFWTNIPFQLPKDKGILLKDILLPPERVAEKLWVNKTFVVKKPSYISASQLTRVGHVGDNDAQANRVYSIDGKSSGLVANAGGLGGKTGLYQIYIPEGGSTADVRVGHDTRRRLNADGVRVDEDKTVTPTRRVELRNDDKCGTLTTVLKDNQVVNIPEKRIRKLDPVECERLQGLPDGYTDGIATTNRYKALGNAFNVDVISHILMETVNFTVTF
jgi:site-specific DNA-cytosine methylase